MRAIANPFDAISPGAGLAIRGAYSASRLPRVGDRVGVDLRLHDFDRETVYTPRFRDGSFMLPTPVQNAVADVVAIYRTPGGAAVEIELRAVHLAAGSSRFDCGPARFVVGLAALVVTSRVTSAEVATSVTLGSAPLAGRAECVA